MAGKKTEKTQYEVGDRFPDIRKNLRLALIYADDGALRAAAHLIQECADTMQRFAVEQQKRIAAALARGAK